MVSKSVSKSFFASDSNVLAKLLALIFLSLAQWFNADSTVNPTLTKVGRRDPSEAVRNLASSLLEAHAQE